MNRWKMLLALSVFSVILSASPAFGESLTIVTPYYGVEDNTFVDDEYGLKLEDSEPMKGLYIQSVDPERYQWNLFLYQTDDLNDSDLWGGNFTYDYYFGAQEHAKNVIGVGVNYMDMDLSGKGVPTKRGVLDALSMDLTVSSYYLRFGRYFDFGDKKLRCSILPWVGGELDRTRGHGSVDFPGPGPGMASFKMDDDQTSFIAGLNLKVAFHHFLQAELKHSITCNRDDAYYRSAAMLNLFVIRNIGLSYRYNRQETAMGTDEYSLLGIAVVF